ncbi:hypothetical protein KOR42_55170 [Thalassoglobus neptunius]|uniref:Uncharacterized protein n=1 Tax=Thalassoglobus neptunius TaxID=1938619 RepID=A0A5C5UVE5_9PLAN|nr:hypothetical protein [Thalassoglobus neptunius]TWT29553.1 hypothetical protein KOR42_55170 [Thalassoglobus neptunius]
MAEPLITRNFSIFLVSLTAVVLAVPFADRNDWKGWAAFFVVVAAVGWIVGTRFWFVARTLRDWWSGHDLD